MPMCLLPPPIHTRTRLSCTRDNGRTLRFGRTVSDCRKSVSRTLDGSICQFAIQVRVRMSVDFSDGGGEVGLQKRNRNGSESEPSKTERRISVSLLTIVTPRTSDQPDQRDYGKQTLTET